MSQTSLKTSVRVLLNAGFAVHPSLLRYLKKHPDPELLIQQFLQSTQLTPSTHPILTEEDMIKYLQNKGTKNHSSQKILSSSSNLNKAILTSKPEIKRQPKKPIHLPQPFTNKSVITTSDSDLEGLLNFEAEIEVTWQPSFSTNHLGKIEDFVQYFHSRYRKIKQIFSHRTDLGPLVPIRQLAHMTTGAVSIIGMVSSKQFSSNGGGIMILEDPTMETPVSCILPKSRPELVEQALRIMDDSVICVKGFLLDTFKISVDEIILPEIPRIRKLNRSEVPVHAAFLSDIHIGSKGFIEKAFDNFIKFLNGEFGNSKMRKIGLQTKFVLFAGDVVDGVGVYPNHEAELSIDNIREQYNEFARFLERIPEDVQIVVIPGNHDQVRPAEPQPIISPSYAPELHGMKNVIMLPNPSQVKMAGVETLLYHCTSLPDILNHIPGLKIEKPVEVMKKMLQARHLAPVWDSRTPIAPEPEDSLVIEKVPDLFHGGHVHINDLGFYNGVTILNSGTMQSQTSYQKALNIQPTPGEVIVINLKTFQPNLIRLLSD